MKYSEAEKQIKALSNKYSVNMDSPIYFEICFKGSSEAVATLNQRYGLRLWNYRRFSKLPFSNKLYMILSELAMTPLNERKDDKKYIVKAFGGILNINHFGAAVFLYGSKLKTKFTLKEIEQLKQREDIPLDWNKVILEETNED